MGIQSNLIKEGNLEVTPMINVTWIRFTLFWRMWMLLSLLEGPKRIKKTGKRKRGGRKEGKKSEL